MGWWCKSNWHGGSHGHGHGDEDAPALSDRGWLAIALDTLRDAPGTGYDVVKRLEERLDGIYTVGPNAIYPVLRLAEDAGFAKAETADGRTVYTLNDEGVAYLDERKGALETFWGKVEARRYGQEVGELFREVKRLAWTVREEAGERRLDKDRLAKIREALAAARKAIGDDLAG